jgi:hypothetical protein|tara:strand:+ start:654 stop:2474 length:1821 start_codon:yes stop_codon:yes gene_type:complete
MATKGERITQKLDDIRDVNEGLKDQISYEKQLNKLYADRDRFGKRQMDAVDDVLDKTKEIFQNRKDLTNEQITSVDLHKLERRLIAEGLEDHIEIVQKLKQEHSIQKEINRTVNAQAKMYEGIGGTIDGFIRKIPGIGGMLADLLGTGDLGKEMSESFRTEVARGGGFLSGAGQELTGSLGRDLFVGKEGTPETKKAIRTLGSTFNQGIMGALGTTASFAVAAKLFSVGLQQGFASQGPIQAVKRFFAGGAFEGIRSALGTGAKAEAGTLRRLVMNKFRFGVSEADQAKILSAQVNIAGLSQKSALNIQQSLASSAAMRGVLPEDVFADIANNTEQFATYAKDGGQNIGEAAIRARELGVSLDTVFKISDGILDFQSSIENELKASLLIGRQLNLNEARRLAMAGDMAGLQEEILRQVGSEEELQRMNAIQRKSLAGALGVTVQELNKLASGDLEVKNSDMKQNTTAMQTLTTVMMAVAGIQGARALGMGAGYVSQMYKKGGFTGAQLTMAQYRKSGLSFQGVSFAEAKMGNPNVNPTLGQRTGLARGGASLAATAGRFGLYGIALATIISLVGAVVRNTKDSAENTKGRGLPNFITSTVTDPLRG